MYLVLLNIAVVRRCALAFNDSDCDGDGDGDGDATSPAINHGVQRKVDNFSYRIDGTGREEEWSRRVGRAGARSRASESWRR